MKLFCIRYSRCSLFFCKLCPRVCYFSRNELIEHFNTQVAQNAYFFSLLINMTIEYFNSTPEIQTYISTVQSSTTDLDNAAKALNDSVNNFLSIQAKFEQNLNILTSAINNIDPSTVSLQNSILTTDASLKQITTTFGSSLIPTVSTIELSVNQFISALQPTLPSSSGGKLSGC